MPIAKETSARLVKERVPYEIISREVVQQLTYPPALAIYTYLITLPENWVVRRQHIIDHFEDMGRKSYDRAMKQLKEVGVVWIAVIRKPDGTIEDRTIMVETVPKATKTTSRLEPQVGLGDHLEIQTVIKYTDIGIEGWQEWCDYRKEIKKKMTPATIKKQTKFLSNRPSIEQQAIIDQSIQNGWTGLFEIKEHTNGQNRQESGHQDTRKLSAVERVREARRRAEQAEYQSPDMGIVVGTQ